MHHDDYDPQKHGMDILKTLYKIDSVEELEKERFRGDPYRETFYFREHREMMKEHNERVKKWQILNS